MKSLPVVHFFGIELVLAQVVRGSCRQRHGLMLELIHAEIGKDTATPQQLLSSRHRDWRCSLENGEV